MIRGSVAQQRTPAEIRPGGEHPSPTHASSKRLMREASSLALIAGGWQGLGNREQQIRPWS